MLDTRGRKHERKRLERDETQEETGRTLLQDPGIPQQRYAQDPGISYDMFDRNAYGFDLKKASMSDHNAYEKAKIDTYVRSDRRTNLDRQW